MERKNRNSSPENGGQEVWLLWQHAADMVMKYLDATLMKQAGISFQQFLVLVTMKAVGGTITATRLSEKLERNPNTLSTILDRMEKGGLVKKIRDQADRRLVRIQMEELGKKKLRETLRTGAKILEKVNTAFTEEEKQNFIYLVGKLDKVTVVELAPAKAAKNKTKAW